MGQLNRRGALAAGLALLACASGAACAQNAEIEVSVPGTAFFGPVPIKVEVRWSGFPVALAELHGSIVVSGPMSGTASNFTTQFPAGPLVNMGAFSGASRLGISVASVPPMFTGGPVFPFGNSGGIVVAEYEMELPAPAMYSARWVPEPGFESLRLYMNASSIAIMEMYTANISTVFYVGGCCPTLCRPDLTGSAIPTGVSYSVPNGTLNNDDFFYYLARFAVGDRGVCDMTTTGVAGSPGYGQPNGVLNNDDFFYYLTIFSDGC